MTTLTIFVKLFQIHIIMPLSSLLGWFRLGCNSNDAMTLEHTSSKLIFLDWASND